MHPVSLQNNLESKIPVMPRTAEHSQNPQGLSGSLQSMWRCLQEIAEQCKSTEATVTIKIDRTLPITPPSLFDPDYVSSKMCTQPYQFYTELQQLQQTAPSYLTFAKLCNCYKLTATGRIFLEDTAVNLLKQFHAKQKPLTIVTVGPGGCYQEMVYLTKLAKAGYNEIQLILLERRQIPLDELSEFCNTSLKGTKVQITQFTSIEAYAHESVQLPRLQPNLLLMLDLSDEKYNVQGMRLPDYAFQTFETAGILPAPTVIAHSVFKQIPNRRSVRTAICSVYDRESHTLAEVKPSYERTLSVNYALSATEQ